MSLIRTVWIGQIKRKSTSLVILLVLTVLLSILSVLPKSIEGYLFDKWRENAELVDVIIGHKGSPTQIIANALYRMENPTGNISVETVEYWKSHPLVASSCAMSLGDNFSGYSIVGVDSSYFRWFGFSIVQGQWPLSAEDAIISKELADQLQIQLGDQIHSSHGSSQGEEHNHHPLRVSGIFDAERYIDRQTIFVQNEAFLEMHHSENVSYTSLLLKLKSKSALLMLPRVIDARNDEQGAFPVFIFGQLEKQWTPILNRISNWSILFVIVLMLIHWAYILSVFRYERIGVELMHIKKQSALRSGTAFFGAYILTVIVGILCFFALANALPFIKYSGIELSLLILLVFIELVSAVYLSKIIHND